MKGLFLSVRIYWFFHLFIPFILIFSFFSSTTSSLARVGLELSRPNKGLESSPVISGLVPTPSTVLSSNQAPTTGPSLPVAGPGFKWKAPDNFPDRKIIFIHGTRVPLPPQVGGDKFECKQTDAKIVNEDAFNPLENYLLDHPSPDLPLSKSDFIYFSYGQNDTENCFDTLVKYQEHYVNFKKIFAQYPDSTFDIIGHSQGGALAAAWLGESATDEERKRVHSVITFDSPLSGVTGDALVSSILQQYCKARGPAVCEDFDQNGYTVKSAIANAVFVANIFYIRHVNDGVVGFQGSSLAGAQGLVDFNNDVSPLEAHAYPLTDPLAFQAVSGVIARQYIRPFLPGLVNEGFTDGYGKPLPYCCNAPALQLSSDWHNNELTGAFNRRTYYTNSPGLASLSFYGKSISIVGVSGKDYGSFSIKIDGESAGDFNLNSAETNFKVWPEKGGFSLGNAPRPHNMTLEAKGDGRVEINYIIVDPIDQPDLPAIAPSGVKLGFGTAFTEKAFQNLWNKSDRPVADRKTSRSWLWGPQPFISVMEPYKEAAGGWRLVQYFDKSRMEINDPNGERSSPYFVTNGLLVVEMMTGRVQLGDNDFVQTQAAEVGVAGDVDDTICPTYADLGKVMNQPPQSTGALVVNTLYRNGSPGNEVGPGGLNVTASYYVPETKHTIAAPFWEYLNSQGVQYDLNGKSYSNLLFSPTFYATGFPVTEAYWTKAKVGGVVKDVLVQAFERRVLTYTPSNPPGFQAEMGNVGQHYFHWRYDS